MMYLISKREAYKWKLVGAFVVVDKIVEGTDNWVIQESTETYHRMMMN